MSLAPAKRTPRAKRNVIEVSYRLYEGADPEKGEEFRLIIRPGENGVTELDIRNYYDTEDSYVFQDLRCCNEEAWMSSEERRNRKKAKQKAAQAKADSMFREHGCYLTRDTMKELEEEQFESWPCRSLEEFCESLDEDNPGDKARILADIAQNEPTQSPAEQRLDEIVSTFPETWKVVYQRVLLNHESKTKVARDLNLCNSRITQLCQQIKARIKKDAFLQEVFS